jgi:muconolactone D-isomerase
MEFLVRIRVSLPPDLPTDQVTQLRSRELAHGRQLRAAGRIVRLWRVPGTTSNVGIWSADTAEELHSAISGLPMFPWLHVTVEPLALHPVEDTDEF